MSDPIRLGPGSRFGPYRVEAQLAVGGMASLWRAFHDERPDQPVVLKTMLPQLAHDPECVSMFLWEASVTGLFQHPNIVTVHDMGVHGGIHFIELEYLPGRNIRQLIRHANRRGAQISLPLACGIIADACAGLAHVHDHPAPRNTPTGLVHRDISPENLVLGDDGVTRLIDFGVATGDRVGGTRIGQIKGKLHYTPPEVFTGRGSGPARDVYAAGVTLYELATGRRPFRADDETELMYRIANEDAPRPSSVQPGLPEEIDDLFATSTNRDPTRRCAAITFAERLRTLLGKLSDQPVRELIRQEIGDIYGRAEPRQTRGFEARPSRIPFGAADGDLFTEARTSALSGIEERTDVFGIYRRSSLPTRADSRSDSFTETPSRPRSDPQAFFAPSSRPSSASHRAESFFGPPARSVSPPPPDGGLSDMSRRSREHFERGLAYRRRGDYESALAEWELAASFEPNNRMLASNVRMMKKKLETP